MRPLFHCEVEFKPSPHLWQIYTGFLQLQKKGVISLNFKRGVKKDVPNGVISVIINDKFHVVYDVLDGFNWIKDDLNKNLQYFQDHFKVDFYFKRSYNSQLLKYLPEGCKLFPLGLNYNIQPDSNLLSLNKNVVDKIKYTIKKSSLLKKLFKTGFLYAEDFEFFPVTWKEDRILFITRLWDPEEATLEHSKTERVLINQTRVACIKACQKKFGKHFTGGLIMNDYTNKNYPSLLMPGSFTNKFRYIEIVKSHSICVATTGLHNSIGWKFGEYVAASRAIVSEPLQYVLPGNFQKGCNYLDFQNVDELLSSIEMFLSDKELLHQIMVNNFHYYNNYVKPENLILNTLLTIEMDDDVLFSSIQQEECAI